MKTRLFPAILALLSLAGCVSAPKQVAYNRDADEVKVLQVLPMRRTEIDLMILNNPGYHFGLIGTAIAEANRIPKRNKLRDHASANGLDHVAELRAVFAGELAKQGYSVRWPDAPVEPAKGEKTRRTGYGLRKVYTPAPEGVDAMLDVNFGMVGYVASGTGDKAPYRPTAVIAVRLVDRDGKRVLFEDLFIYNNVFNEEKAVTIEADPAYAYPDFNDLDAAGPKAIVGLRGAVHSIAVEVARHL